MQQLRCYFDETMRILPQDIDPKDFYQSKYKFYRRFSFWAVIFAAIGTLSYFVSDCQLFGGRFAWETLPARLTPIIPMIAFIILNKKTRNYKIMGYATYAMIHCCLWCTMWAVYYLPDKTHFSEGSIVLQLAFFAVNFAFPLKMAIPMHTLQIVTILLTHPIIHYPNIDLLLSLNIPCWVAICLAHFVMQNLYVKHYQTTKKLQYISTYDQLTGARNRNITKSLLKPDTTQFMDELAQPLCVAMFDIDFFKQVNDQYGHAKGDIVLKDFASIVLKEKIDTDLFIRWGGEEFVLIMPNTELDTAVETVDSIRKKIMAFNQGVCPITISAGVAKYDGRDYKRVIDNADKALYSAKNSGRNKVVSYQK